MPSTDCIWNKDLEGMQNACIWTQPLDTCKGKCSSYQGLLTQAQLENEASRCVECEEET